MIQTERDGRLYASGMVPVRFLGYIPSPPANGISVGGLRLHAYGLMIALGIVTAVWVAQRRWSRIGGRAGVMSSLAIWGVPGGLVGARVYSLVTSWNVDTGGHILRAFAVWDGGLGIWGGVLGGIATGLYGARRHGLPYRPLLDCVAPAFAVAQAIGRLGNYFNQELYGWQSNLPWAVKIDHPSALMPDGRPYPPGTTFQPCFLYELVWDLLVAGALVWLERRLRIRRGYLLAAYAALYTFGRFFIEYMRIDPAHRYLGLRLNDWTSIVVFAVAAGIFLLRGLRPTGDDVAGAPLAVHLAASPGEATDPRSGRAAGPGSARPVAASEASPHTGTSRLGPDQPTIVP
jgi:prolipoprotein diacylglyceryl transferase